jgi:hypothetical protein
MKRLFTQSSAFRASSLTLVFLLLILVLPGCSPANDSRTGGNPPRSPKPISSSADVVKLSAEAVSIPAGGNLDARVLVSISPGFHVNANPATFPYLIATELTTGKAEGITVGVPAYPAAVKRKFQFEPQPLAVYEGDAPIQLSLRAEKTAGAGSRSLPITVRVQACDEEKCYPPATLNSTISVTVK